MASAPVYHQRPIGSCETLARALQTPLADLEGVCCIASNMYRTVIKKKDGSPRNCCDAFAQLKQIQGRINRRILSEVEFPTYLTGGITGRSHFENTVLHVRSKFCVSEDIAGFFPSITDEAIFDIWFNFFRFSPDVSRMLTLLTTKGGCLPEGARTSTNLANLAFWRSEPKMVERLLRMGFRYSRHVDDVTISSVDVPPDEQIEAAIKSVADMVLVSGMRLKRKKHCLRFSGQRREATGLLIDREGAIPRSLRSAIRSQVHKCEELAETNSPMATEMKNRTRSRIGQLKRFHPKLAKELKNRLDRCV